MQVDLQRTTLKDVEAWLIQQICGEKRGRGAGSNASDENPIAKQLDAGMITYDNQNRYFS